MSASSHLTLFVNGERKRIRAKQNETLSQILRERLRLTGTKVSCDEGTCGSCTVVMDGEPVYSCLLLAASCEGKSITTIEGLQQGEKLHPLQQAFLDTESSQCGFCTPGFIMSAKALLDRVPNPTVEEIRKSLSGNICRCTNYTRYVESVALASRKMRGEV